MTSPDSTAHPGSAPGTADHGTVTPGGAGGPLDAEDAKLVVLARGARGRAGAAEGAAVRDEDGRTYAAATVALKSLRLTAAQAAIAAAVASGAQELEALVVVGDATVIDPASRAAAADLATAVTVLVGTDGTVRSRSVRSGTGP